MTSSVALIPAFRPGQPLVDVVAALAAGNPAGSFQEIVVVDDGSGAEYAHVFAQVAATPGVTVVAHAINLGKGAALKTGLNWILCHHPTAGIVTLDADGQHHPEDIFRVSQRFARQPECLVMGVRSFAGSVPLRSRVGNLLTRYSLRLLVGQNLIDTQSGLRAIPRALAGPLLRVAASGYEFELEMLIAARQLGIRVVQEPIRTIYEPGNPTSHFQPLQDSMRIYFVLLRFSLVALMTAVIDNVLFSLVFHATGGLVGAQLTARLAAGIFNYSAVRRAAFHSDEAHSVLLPRYILLVAVNAIVSYAGIRFVTGSFHVAVVPAKLFVEALLFVANFAIQRDFVFTRRGVKQ